MSFASVIQISGLLRKVLELSSLESSTPFKASLQLHFAHGLRDYVVVGAKCACINIVHATCDFQSLRYMIVESCPCLARASFCNGTTSTEPASNAAFAADAKSSSGHPKATCIVNIALKFTTG